jgi:hypothetical protein
MAVQRLGRLRGTYWQKVVEQINRARLQYRYLALLPLGQTKSAKFVEDPENLLQATTEDECNKLV